MSSCKSYKFLAPRAALPPAFAPGTPAGFDSIPFDLGALLAVRHLAERYGKQPARVLNTVLGSKGGVSGGTIARWVRLSRTV